MKTGIRLRHIAAVAAVLLALVLFVFTAAACGDDPVVNNLGKPIEGWSDDWGSDDWGDGYKPPSFDPEDYNKIDWTEKYGAFTEGGIEATKGNEYIPFYPGNGAHIYQAECAELLGSANTTEGGYYVGSLDNSSVTFRFESEFTGTALVVAALAVNPSMPAGLPFNQQYSMYSNDARIDTSDCWILGTDGWWTFKENAIGEISLVEGEVNTVEFFSGFSSSNLDYIKIVPTKDDAAKYPPAPEKYMRTFDINERIEAENTDFANARIETNTVSTGVALSWTSFDTTIEFIVRNSLDVDVTRTLRMFAATGEGGGDSGELSPLMAERMTLTVGGEPVTLEGDLPMTPGGDWYNTYMNIDIAEVTLKANSDTMIKFTLSDRINIDYFELVGEQILTGITVSGQKTAYLVGSSVSDGDLTVTANYDHGESKTLEWGEYTVSPDSFETESEAQTVTVTYTEGGVTRTAEYDVVVTDTVLETPSSISLSEIVCDTEYLEGEKFVMTSATVRGDYGAGLQAIEKEDYSLSYSLSENDGYAAELTLPMLDVRQALQQEVTVYIRATYNADPSLTATAEARVTVYDEAQYNIMNTYLPYDEANVEGMFGDKFPTFLPANGVYKYEAERAVLGGIATNHGNYVGDLRHDNEKGDATVTFTFDSAADENVTVLLVMSLAINPSFVPAGGDGAYFVYSELPGNKVTVNGVDVVTDGMVKDTNSWTTYAESAVAEITVKPGANTILLTFAADATNLDYIKLVPTKTDAAAGEPNADVYTPVFDAADRIEAELAHYVNARPEVGGDRTNLGWTSFDTTIEFIVRNSLDVDVTRTLRMFAATGEGGGDSGELSPLMAERMTLTVGGEPVTLEGDLPMTPGGDWYNTYMNIDIAEVTLKANSDTMIKFTLSDRINIDYFELVGEQILTGITVSGQKTAYLVGSSVSDGDLTVTANYDHGESKTLEWGEYTVSPDSFETESEAQTVTVTYTEGGVTRTAEYDVVVTDTVLETPSSISLSEIVCDTEYLEGEKFVMTSATVRGDYGAGLQAIEKEDYSLSYSLSENDGYAAELTLPMLDVRQALQQEVTVYIRATYNADPSLTATAEARVTVYDEAQYNIMNTYLPYDEANVEGMFGDKFIDFRAADGVHLYEAERGVLGGIATNMGNYVGDLRHDNEKGDATVTFTINSVEESDVTVLLVASLSVNPGFVPESGDSVYFPFSELPGNKITVNGVDVVTDGMVKDTNDWNVFAEGAIAEITLKPGENTIVFTFAADATTNLDYIKLVPTKTDAAAGVPDPDRYVPVFAADDRVEVESTHYVNARPEVGDDRTNLGWTSKDTVVEFFVENDTDAPVTKTLVMHAAAGLGDATSGDLSPNMAERLTLTVDGKPVALSGLLPVTDEEGVAWYFVYMDMEIAEVTLEANSKTLIRLTLSDQINPDWFELRDVA